MRPRDHRHRLISLAAVMTLALVACGEGQGPQQAPRQAVTVATLVAKPVTLRRELPGRTHARHCPDGQRERR